MKVCRGGEGGGQKTPRTHYLNSGGPQKPLPSRKKKQQGRSAGGVLMGIKLWGISRLLLGPIHLPWGGKRGTWPLRLGQTQKEQPEKIKTPGREGS